MKRINLHRVEQGLVGLYILLFFGAVAIIFSGVGGSATGGSLVPIVLSWLVVGLALCLGILLLLANALTAVVTAEPDWTSVALAGATAGSILTAAVLNAISSGNISAFFVVLLAAWGALVGPAAIALHVFRFPSMDILRR